MNIVYVIIFFLFTNSLTGSCVEEGLKKIPLDEKISLRKFCDYAFKKDQLGHVLFFNTKPACLTGPLLKDRNKCYIDRLCLKGWQAFKKNESLFPHPNFIFSEEIIKDKDFAVLQIYIFNKKILLKCLNQNKNIFLKYIGNEFTSENFIAELENGKKISELIHHHQVLLGIILGFGLDSAQDFEQAHANQDSEYIPPWTEYYCGIDVKKPQGCKIDPIAFMGNPNSQEVQELVSTYANELARLWFVYRKQDPVKLFLEGICAE